MLRFLYETVPGRCILKLLTRPGLSKLVGQFLDTRLSRRLIQGFVKKHKIDLSEYEDVKYQSFNQFFYRKIKAGKREIDRDAHAFVAPCDGLLSIYPIEEELVIPVKNSRFRISDLLKDSELSKQFDKGTCLVFRLCVNHYHRYIHIDDGIRGESHFIKGKLHTVRPIALRNTPVFIENAREYTVIHTEHFSDIVQMEVGAMLVGRITNHKGDGRVKKGEEKGYFEYGGSTIIVLVKEGAVGFSKKLFEETEKGREIEIRQGMRLNV